MINYFDARNKINVKKTKRIRRETPPEGAGPGHPSTP